MQEVLSDVHSLFWLFQGKVKAIRRLCLLQPTFTTNKLLQLQEPSLWRQPSLGESVAALLFRGTAVSQSP
jgi:hypothetical protein